jgi:ATP-dependent DNA helicase PIF1
MNLFGRLLHMTQNDALTLLKMGRNVFLTGAAGSGKTYVLNQFINYLKWNDVFVATTASTGIAATHLGGVTIHSYSGIGIRSEVTEKDIKVILGKSHVKNKIQATKVLLIDEISMLSASRLDMVEKVFRAGKGEDSPFGGVQVIFCGDFFQLPPVTVSAAEDARFAYDADIWPQMDLSICYLSEQHRQGVDPLTSVLNSIRSGAAGDGVVETLSERYQKEIKGVESPTKLYTHNIDVDSINSSELSKIPGTKREYVMSTTGIKELCEILKKSCLAPETLNLKKGSQVMFVKNNFDKGYVNGTLGTVIGFEKNGDPIVQLLDGNTITASAETWLLQEENVVKAQISQIPLRLAWAITVHKSQGMSLDAAEIDLSKAFVPGMGYVALSRLRSLSGLRLVGFSEMALKVSEEVLKKDLEFQRLSMEEEMILTKTNKMDKEKRIKNYLNSIS